MTSKKATPTKNRHKRAPFKSHKQTDKHSFDALEAVLKPFDVPGRTQSASFLVWFLQSIYRLDEVEAQDAVCDKTLDKGIDALFVNDGDEEVVLFQAKRAEKIPATLGDNDLKKFIGALAQFRFEATVAEMASTTQNPELKRLLVKNDVAAKIGKGYKLRPIFISNIAANDDAEEYVRFAGVAGDDIDLWDLERITPVLKQLTQQEWFVPEEATLNINPKMNFYEGAEKTPDLIIAAVSAKEMIKLSGISDTRIFAQNVRLGLGDTRVNTELVSSIKEGKEHKKFLTYHNGLTVVAKEISLARGKITLKNYSVCNGCQSLLSLYKNQTCITNNLTLLVRFVRVGEDRSLAASIAYKTNNQNPISLRDLSANDSTQTQIRAEFDSLFGFDSNYLIKRGAPASKKDLPNELAGQLLLSLYAKEPWSSHQKYKIFGELEPEIFKYGINANHIRFAQLAMQECEKQLGKCKQAKVRTYGLTRFLVLYFVGELMRKQPDGESILDNPAKYLRHSNLDSDRANLERELMKEISSLAGYAVTELNYYIEDHGGDAYDYKSEFKSEKNVGAIRLEILKSYDKDRFRDKVDPFKAPTEVKPIKQKK